MRNLLMIKLGRTVRWKAISRIIPRKKLFEYWFTVIALEFLSRVCIMIIIWRSVVMIEGTPLILISLKLIEHPDWNLVANSCSSERERERSLIIRIFSINQPDRVKFLIVTHSKDLRRTLSPLTSRLRRNTKFLIPGEIHKLLRHCLFRRLIIDRRKIWRDLITLAEGNNVGLGRVSASRDYIVKDAQEYLECVYDDLFRQMKVKSPSANIERYLIQFHQSTKYWNWRPTRTHPTDESLFTTPFIQH